MELHMYIYKECKMRVAICAFMFTFPNTGSYRLLKLIGEMKFPSGMIVYVCVYVSVWVCVCLCVCACVRAKIWGKKLDENKN